MLGRKASGPTLGGIAELPSGLFVEHLYRARDISWLSMYASLAMEVRIMSVCQPRWSGIRTFVQSSKSLLLLGFLLSLGCLLYGRPAFAQHPPGDVDTPVT